MTKKLVAKKPVKKKAKKKPVAKKKVAKKKSVAAKRPIEAKVELPTKDDVREFYGQFGIVNSVGTTVLDENGKFSSKGLPGFHVTFESLIGAMAFPDEYRGVRVKVDVVGKIMALEEDPWDDIVADPIPVPPDVFKADEDAFAKRVSRLTKEIKIKLQPGKG